MRTLIIVGVCFLVLLCVVVPGIWGHLTQLPKDLGRSIDENAPIEHSIGVALDDLNRAEKNLFEIFTSIRDLERKMEDVKSDRDRQQKDLKREEEILKASALILERYKPGDKIPIGGYEHSWDGLNNESLQRVQKCEFLQKNIQGNEKLLARLQQTCDRGKKNLEAKQAKLKKDRVDLDIAKVEIKVREREQEIDTLIGRFNGIADSASDLKSLAVVRQQLNRVRDRGDYQDSQNVSSDIAWDKQLGLVPEKATESIGSYFQKTEPTPVLAQ